MRATALLLIFVTGSVPLRAQTSTSDSTRLAQIKQFLTEERWQEIVRLAENDTARSPELNYYYGIALARLERWEDAKKAFQRGLSRRPEDKRFPEELAGVFFKQKNYAKAADYLRLVLRLDPSDAYANDFLASVYFLQGNLEAALKYWNRVSKPQIEEVRHDPITKVDPVLLDQSFAFAPVTVLRLDELETTEARVGGLNVFPNYRFDLEARSDGKFDVVFRARERIGWGTGRWEGLIALFRSLAFQTVHPEFFNMRRRAINWVSLVRWDGEKERFRTNLSGPFSLNPKWRYELDLDLRSENWDIRNSFSGSAPRLADLNLRKQAFTARVTSFVNGRWDWSAGVELSHRDFRDVIPSDGLTPQLLAQGFQLKYIGRAQYRLARAPERRLVVTAGASTQLGRTWSEPSHAFAKLLGSMKAHWFPQAAGDDYEMHASVHAGKTFGKIPFDELFILGVERDNDLWLRAHIGTRDGRKGSAPMGRTYLLSNWELDKNLYSGALVSVKLGPFLDSGKISDSFPQLGSRRWHWDIGVQAKVRMLGLGVALSYGKDLRAGKDAFYVSMPR